MALAAFIFPLLRFRNGNPHFYRKLGTGMDLGHYWKQEVGRCVARCAYRYPADQAEQCWGSIMGQFESQLGRQYADLFAQIKKDGR